MFMSTLTTIYWREWCWLFLWNALRSLGIVLDRNWMFAFLTRGISYFMKLFFISVFLERVEDEKRGQVNISFFFLNWSKSLNLLMQIRFILSQADWLFLSFELIFFFNYHQEWEIPAISKERDIQLWCCKF